MGLEPLGDSVTLLQRVVQPKVERNEGPTDDLYECIGTFRGGATGRTT